ncbi:MAG: shikimate dehydrogenase [Elusimicrobia bacterium]|nr:shikimate dehydrogenase [Elusimicrobiota bacterium]
MKRFAVLGCPIGHSRSPALMNGLFRRLGLDATYRALRVERGRLAEAVRTLGALRFVGANVTIPHKEEVLRLVDWLSPQARGIGAVNTLFWRSGRLEGHNTDADGFLSALRGAGFRPRGRGALIYGAGGAARAAAYALLKGGAPQLHFSARRSSQARAAARHFGLLFPEADVGTVAWDEKSVAPVLKRKRLIVNATPLGMGVLKAACPPLPWSALTARHRVVDLVYQPERTRLLTMARAKGARGMNGLSMLRHQAAGSVGLWLGRRAQARALRFWKENPTCGF